MTGLIILVFFLILALAVAAPTAHEANFYFALDFTILFCEQFHILA